MYLYVDNGLKPASKPKTQRIVRVLGCGMNYACLDFTWILVRFDGTENVEHQIIWACDVVDEKVPAPVRRFVKLNNSGYDTTVPLSDGVNRNEIW